MKITDLLKKQSICLDGKADSKEQVIREMVDLMAEGGNINDIDTYRETVFKREEEGTTGIGEGIAIPHGKTEAVSAPGLAAMVLPEGVDYDSLDGEPAYLIFLIAAPNSEDNVHLEVLSRLSMLLMDEDFRNKLLHAKDVDEFLAYVDAAEKENSRKKQKKKQKLRRMHLQNRIRSSQLPHARPVSPILTWRRKVWKRKRKKWELPSR